jgi:hypothetical protein
MALNKHYIITATFAGLLVASPLIWENAQAEKDAAGSQSKATKFSGDPNKPRRHFRVRDIAEMSAGERQAGYMQIRKQLQAGYAISGNSAAKEYQKWSLVNTAPYRSSTHGQRFINNYVNNKASAYRNFEASGPLPIGAIIAKDSFVATTDGEVSPGPLFLMEKMAKGFNYVSGDWRYSMIMPDGSVFGITKGVNAERVDFCIGCHLAREKFDHLFYVPNEYRVQ